MKAFRVDLIHGGNAIERHSFDTLQDAERHYWATDPPYPLVLELWEWVPPARVVFGHTFRGYWTKRKEKQGPEEAC